MGCLLFFPFYGHTCSRLKGSNKYPEDDITRRAKSSLSLCLISSCSLVSLHKHLLFIVLASLLIRVLVLGCAYLASPIDSSTGKKYHRHPSKTPSRGFVYCNSIMAKHFTRKQFILVKMELPTVEADLGLASTGTLLLGRNGKSDISAFFCILWHLQKIKIKNQNECYTQHCCLKDGLYFGSTKPLGKSV